MLFSPSLEASIVITVPPNIHVSTIKNPFPYFQENHPSMMNDGEVEQLIQKWLEKRTVAKIHQQQMLNRADVKQLKPIIKSDRMKKIVSVCTNAFANTKDNPVARVFSCVLQGFEKS